MNKQILILLTTILFLSCNQQKKEEILVRNETEINQKVVERYFPEEKDIVVFDTIISERNLKISIQNRFLDSYVTNECDSENIKYIDKYRDSEKHLVIELANEILIDSVFKKNDFEELVGQDFLQIADFHGYWFNGIKNETIELFGVIGKPETDWTFAFYHYFDLKTKKFKIIEHIDEEI